MRKRPSSYDVARQAGVSQATVSLVLSGRGSRISSATKERVLAAARSLGYVVSEAGRALATGQTGRIGFVPQDPKRMIANAYYQGVLSGMIDVAAEQEYGLLVFTNSTPDIDALAAEILGRSVDAVVLLGRSEGDELAGRLQAAHFPVVCASYRPDVEGVPVVDVDKLGQGRLMAEALGRHGHRKIAFSAQAIDNSWNQTLMAGLQEGGRLQVDFVGTDSMVDAARLAREGYTAVVIAEEYRAHAVYQSGLHGMSLVSCLHFHHRTWIELSGVVEPVEETGRRAASAAIRLLRQEPVEPLTVLPVSWRDGQTLHRAP